MPQRSDGRNSTAVPGLRRLVGARGMASIPRLVLMLALASVIAGLGVDAGADDAVEPRILQEGRQTEVFHAPRLLVVRVVGLPGDTDSVVTLALRGSHDRLEIPLDRWRSPVTRTVRVPDPWVGRPVQVMVHRTSPGDSTLRISSVRSTTRQRLVFEQSPALALPAVVAFIGLMLLAPGLALLTFLSPEAVPDGFGPALALLVTCVFGYLAFWIYLVSPHAGRVYALLLFVVSLLILAARRRQAASRFTAAHSIVPILGVLLSSTFYLSVLYAVDTGEAPDTAATTRFFLARPLDNLIPEHFAERLYDGADPRVTGPEWTSSDRPPLQAGLVLLTRPATDAFGMAPAFAYQVVGTILQCSWIPVLWALLTILDVPPRHRAIVFGFTVFSGFFLYNSVYVWPKLLAGSLILLAAVIVIRRGHDGVCSKGALATAAVASSLALMAHSGAAFTLVGLSFAFVLTGVVSVRRNVGPLLMAGSIGFILLLPWAAYQKIYDPPGDRLLKIHLAGVNDRSDERSAAAAIADAWRNVSAGEIVARRLHNLKTLTGFEGVMSSAVTAEDPRLVAQTRSDPLLMWRTREQQHVGTSLGLLNLGWIALVAVGLRARTPSGSIGLMFRLLLGGLSGLAVASILLFSGGSTVTTHVSHADVMLLHFCLAAALVGWTPRGALLLLALHLAHFTAVWIWTTPPVPGFAVGGPLNLPAVGVAVLTFGALVSLLVRLGRRR